MSNPHHIEIDLRDGPDEVTLTAVLGDCIELLEVAGCTGLDWSLRHGEEGT